MRQTYFVRFVLVAAAFLCVLSAVPALGKEPKLKAEELVAKHLEAIGPAQVRTAVQSRTAQGGVQLNETIKGGGRLLGRATMISLGRKLRCEWQFGNPSYPGETFVFDGSNVQVKLTAAGARSNLGDFLLRQTQIMREGLFGGVLFTSWPLLNLEERQPRLRYEGLKKIKGRELHEMSYLPKRGGGDLQIKLYFEPETTRHVMTVYKLNIVAGPSGGLADQKPNLPGQTEDTQQILEESFDDFRQMDGLTLPARWKIHYRVEPNQPEGLQWEVIVNSVTHNNVN